MLSDSVGEYPEAIKKFVQKFNINQNEYGKTSNKTNESIGNLKSHPKGLNRFRQQNPIRVKKINKFNLLSSDDIQQARFQSDQIGSDSNRFRDSFEKIRSEKMLSNSLQNDQKNSNDLILNSNPYTLIRHYFSTYTANQDDFGQPSSFTLPNHFDRYNSNRIESKPINLNQDSSNSLKMINNIHNRYNGQREQISSLNFWPLELDQHSNLPYLTGTDQSQLLMNDDNHQNDLMMLMEPNRYSDFDLIENHFVAQKNLQNHNKPLLMNVEMNHSGSGGNNPNHATKSIKFVSFFFCFF